MPKGTEPKKVSPIRGSQMIKYENDISLKVFIPVKMLEAQLGQTTKAAKEPVQ